MALGGLGGQFSRLVLVLVFCLTRSTLLGDAALIGAAIVVVFASTSGEGLGPVIGAVGAAAADAALPVLRPRLAPRPGGRLLRAGAGSLVSAVGTPSTSMSAACWAPSSPAEAAEVAGLWWSAEPPGCWGTARASGAATAGDFELVNTTLGAASRRLFAGVPSSSVT